MFVHSFESMAALDGEGLRYAVFLSGCPLKCVYCHNVDTRYTSGVEYSPEQILKKAVRMKPYFEESGGGITFSGGEPLLQADEIVKTAELLKINKINYALDTSGAVELSDSVKQAVLKSELVICDLKFYNSQDFLKYARGNFDLVIKFFNFLLENNVRTWVRTVIVPNINDKVADIVEYAKVIKPFMKVVEKYKLLAFHTLGFFKYEKLGIENPLKNYGPLEQDKLFELQKILDSELTK